MSSARAVSALPHRDISSAWAWLFWAFGCCRDSLAGLLILLCLKFPLPYPHTEVPPTVSTHWSAPPYPHTGTRNMGYEPTQDLNAEVVSNTFRVRKNRLTPESRARKKLMSVSQILDTNRCLQLSRSPLQVTTQVAGKTDLHTEAPGQSPTWAGFFRDAMIQLCGEMHHGVDRDMQTSDSSGPVRTGQLSCISRSTRSRWWEPASQILWHSALLRCLDEGRR